MVRRDFQVSVETPKLITGQSQMTHPDNQVNQSKLKPF